MVPSFCSTNHQGVLLLSPGWDAISLQGYQGYHQQYAISRVAKSSRLPVKIAAYLVSIGWLLCLAFLYGWCFLHKISLDWPLTLTTQPSTSKLSDNPASVPIYTHGWRERKSSKVSCFRKCYANLRLEPGPNRSAVKGFNCMAAKPPLTKQGSKNSIQVKRCTFTFSGTVQWCSPFG